MGWLRLAHFYCAPAPILEMIAVSAWLRRQAVMRQLIGRDNPQQ
jgi:hypothetical protein